MRSLLSKSWGIDCSFCTGKSQRILVANFLFFFFFRTVDGGLLNSRPEGQLSCIFRSNSCQIVEQATSYFHWKRYWTVRHKIIIQMNNNSFITKQWQSKSRRSEQLVHFEYLISDQWSEVKFKKCVHIGRNIHFNVPGIILYLQFNLKVSFLCHMCCKNSVQPSNKKCQLK